MMYDEILEDVDEFMVSDLLHSKDSQQMLIQSTTLMLDSRCDSEILPIISLNQAPGRRLNLRATVGASVYTRVNTLREVKAILQDSYFLRRDKTQFELIDDYEDSAPLLGLRKALMRLKAGFSQFCYEVVRHKYFDAFIMLVILLNIINLMMEDPTKDEQARHIVTIETVCLYIYTVECLMKISALGFIFGKDTYLRDSWNVLDFFIVVQNWIEVFYSKGVKLTALRALRVLRALKSVNSIKGLKILITSLLRSLKPLMSSFAVFFFFIYLFAIGGLQMWMGMLRYRCMDEETGEILDEICGTHQCAVGQTCVLGLENPYQSTISFDDIFSSLLVVFQCVTLEGWTHIMTDLTRAFGYPVCLFFIPLVFIGAFFLLNLVLAVLKTEFTKTMEESRNAEGKQEQEAEEDNIDSSIERLMMEIYEEELEEGLDEKEIPQIVIESPRDNEKENVHQPLTGSMRLLKKRPTMTSTDLNSDESITQKNKKEDAAYETCGAQKTQPCLDIKRKPSIKAKPKESFLARLFGIKVTDKIRNMVSETALTTTSSDEDVLISPKLVDTIGKQKSKFAYCTDVKEDSPNFHDKFFLFKRNVSITKAANAFSIYANDAAHIIRQKRLQDSDSAQMQGHWSGTDLSMDFKSEMSERLSEQEYRLWALKPWTKLSKARHLLKVFVNGRLFNNVMTLCVVANTIVLAIDHYGISDQLNNDLQTTNFAFTIIFTIELSLKLLGLGFAGYAADSMNFLDAAVVLFSLMEFIFLSGNSSMTAIRALRVFRAFRVFRVARLFRRMESMAEIMRVISSTLSGVTYLALLLLLFIVIFSLVGMQTFGGAFDFPEGKPRSNFDSFFEAFITVFQILTLENWPDLLYNGMRSSAGYASALYFLFWIFIGNFVCLNLFLAILFDGFGNMPTDEVQEEDGDAPRKSLLSASSEKELMNKKKLLIEQMKIKEVSDSSDVSSNILIVDEKIIGVKGSNSLGLFTKNNLVRKLCIKICNSRKFEVFIVLMIFISAIKLVLDTYLIDKPDDSSEVKASKSIDYIITAVFILEMMIKVIALGFVFNKLSYLRDSWNQLDFIIVVVSIIEISVTDVSLSFIKILRLFRTLRPLRFISQNSSMKLVVTSLMESIAAIVNVGIVLLILFIIFAILGVSLFSGKMTYCSNSIMSTKDECENYGFEWVRNDYNFDNIFEAMLTLFAMSTLEGWPDLMYQGVDATEYDQAPKKDSNPLNALYFIIFITVIVFFFMNLFIGVIFMKFHQAKLSENLTLLLSKEQNFWVELQKLIVRSKPKRKRANAPTEGLRYYMYKIAKSKHFMYFIMACIVLNMLVLSIDYYTASSAYKQALLFINLVFTGVFLVEACIKLIGLGHIAYFGSSWNCFDFFVVVASMVDIFLTFSGGSSISILRVGPQLIRVLRVLRVSKLMRLVKSLETIQNLIQILTLSLPAVLSVLALLGLVYFVYAILGVFLFHSITSGQVIDAYTNFHDFGFALLILLRVSTGEEWNLILFDCIDKVGYPAPLIYFISFVLITSVILLHLLVMVVLQEYEDVENDPESALKVFKIYLKDFRSLWAELSDRRHPERLHYRQVLEVLKNMSESLSLSQEALETKGYVYLCAIGVKIDVRGYAIYNDVLYCVLKRKHATKLVSNKNQVQRRIIENSEVKTAKFLARLRKKSCRSLEVSRTSAANTDPWLKLFYMTKVLREWHRYTMQRQTEAKLSSLADEELLFPSMNTEHAESAERSKSS
mmetsp:Transcript_13676/g.25803  ORF Transcript_13676/g.25803 Transcript_13676/m.25803 type:complete len:1737 (+) Transcript_13676:154-5364(+)